MKANAPRRIYTNTLSPPCSLSFSVSGLFLYQMAGSTLFPDITAAFVAAAASKPNANIRDIPWRNASWIDAFQHATIIHIKLSIYYGLKSTTEKTIVDGCIGGRSIEFLTSRQPFIDNGKNGNLIKINEPLLIQSNAFLMEGNGTLAVPIYSGMLGHSFNHLRR